MKSAKPSRGNAFKEVSMLSYCIDLLSLFLLPFQDYVLDSVLGVFLLLMLCCFPVLFFCRLFRLF